MPVNSLFRTAATALAGLLICTVAHALPTIVVGPGTSPGGGFLPLSLFGTTPIAGVGDETIINFVTPSFRYGGQNWSRLGVVSNGYVLIGGGAGADVQKANTDLPSPGAPANILAPFWTDLNPGSGGAVRIATLTDGADDWIVIEWEAVRSAVDVEVNSFQIWIGVDGDDHPDEDITFAYGAVGDGDGGLLTVGAQDVSRTVGDAFYFNGAGTLPTNGTQLRVTTRELPVPVPEPGTLALVGFAGLALVRRRKL